MRFRRKLGRTVICSAAAIIAALGATAGAAQAARQTGTPRLTWAKVFALTPARVSALEKPLLAVANPLQAVGSTAMRGIYWGVALDTPRNGVDLYVTDPRQAAGLIAAARRLDPRLDASLIQVKRTAYSFAALTAAGKRLMAASDARRLPFRLYAAGQLDRGASLLLMVPSAAQARGLSEVPLASLGGRSVAQLAGVRLTFQQGRPVPLTRENDTAPFIGGDFLTNGVDACSAGISIENPGNRDFLITANHCFKSGIRLTTQNQRTGVGTPYRYNVNYDALLIDTGKANGAGANSDEGESNTPNGGISYFPVPDGVSGVFGGEQICQDGIASYILRNAVPCNQAVDGTVFADIQGQNGPAAWVLVYLTNTTNNAPVASAGDSGAVAFTFDPATPNVRHAAGMPVAGFGCNANGDCTQMGFVFWSDLLNAFGFTGHLNPHI